MNEFDETPLSPENQTPAGEENNNQYEQTPETSDGIPTGKTQIILRLPPRKPVVTYVTLGITIVVFLLQLGSEFLYQIDYPLFFLSKINEYIQVGQFWRLITPVLLHGSIAHIGFNMYALYALGPELERFYGHWRFLALYLIGGFTGNVFSFLFSDSISVGASTAIFGLVAAQGIFIFKNKQFFRNTRKALTNIIMVIAFNLVLGLSPGIDNFGHLGGLIGGASFAWLAGPLLKISQIDTGFQLADSRLKNDILLAGSVIVISFIILTGINLYIR
jgi:rhomboid protease GluP